MIPKNRLTTSNDTKDGSLGLPETGEKTPQTASGLPPLEERLRQGANNFQFDSLIRGVSTLEETSLELATNPVPEREGNSVAAQKSERKPKVSLINIISVVAVVVIAMLGAVYLGQVANRSRSANSVATSALLPNPFLKSGLPDPVLSPGEYTGKLATSNAVGVTTTLPVDVQRQVRTAYGLEPNDTSYVICYVVPPLLGGTEGVTNLFPTTPWFQDLKLRLDVRLLELVTAGKLTVPMAQKELTTNWVKAVHRYSVRNYGENSSDKAQELEKQINWGK